MCQCLVSRKAILGMGFVAVLLLAARDLVGQGRGVLQGTVTIVGGSDGFPGVRVRIPALQREALTDGEGRFAFLSVPPGAHEIHAEVIGCRPGSWPVEVRGGESVSIRLKIGGSAFGSPRPAARAAQRTLTLQDEPPYTVERLGREELRHDPGSTIADLLRGAFPGVKVIQGSGIPGGAVSIQFRGPGSISGSEDPLIVVDGVITGGGLDGLDPRDVESLEILKGSAGSAMYGARGRAGVIEITTTRGTPTAPAACFFWSEPSR